MPAKLIDGFEQHGVREKFDRDVGMRARLRLVLETGRKLTGLVSRCGFHVR